MFRASTCTFWFHSVSAKLLCKAMLKTIHSVELSSITIVQYVIITVKSVFVSHVTAHRCNFLPHVDNAVVDNINVSVMSTLTYTCIEGHVYPDGSSMQRITCNQDSNGTYSWNNYHLACGGI